MSIRRAQRHQHGHEGQQAGSQQAGSRVVLLAFHQPPHITQPHQTPPHLPQQLLLGRRLGCHSCRLPLLLLLPQRGSLEWVGGRAVQGSEVVTAGGRRPPCCCACCRCTHSRTRGPRPGPNHCRAAGVLRSLCGRHSRGARCACCARCGRIHGRPRKGRIGARGVGGCHRRRGSGSCGGGGSTTGLLHNAG